MPLFHSNSLGLAFMTVVDRRAATLAIARRFSARGFLRDVRRYQATAFNYVGKPLAYILATEERPDDRRQHAADRARQWRHRHASRRSSRAASASSR